MRILIADDSRVMRQIVPRTLRQAGFTGHDVVEAADGRQACDAVAAEQPGLVPSGAPFLIGKPFTADMFRDVLDPILG